MQIDLPYLCTTIGNLSGVPVRIFEGENLTFYYSQVYLPRDPMAVYRDQVFAVKAHVGYITTPHFHYYGIVNSGQTKIVIGPTRQITETDQELRELAFRADVTADDTEDFITGMKSIVRMPFESILQMLCTMNHVMNGETLSLKDITIYDADQEKLLADQGRQQAAQKLAIKADEVQSLHNTLSQEQALLRMVRKGDTAALKEWVSRAPAIRGGVGKGAAPAEEKHLYRDRDAGFPRRHPGRHGRGRRLFTQRLLYPAVRAAVLTGGDHEPAISDDLGLHGTGRAAASGQAPHEAHRGCGKLHSAPPVGADHS